MAEEKAVLGLLSLNHLFGVFSWSDTSTTIVCVIKQVRLVSFFSINVSMHNDSDANIAKTQPT